eukprot:Tamp_13370.p1 GENE.Tamp_13370~~Tamp_13370.p1  ORF type:complete len:230 (+),score=61.70 Tamp_13370:3-692(+)
MGKIAIISTSADKMAFKGGDGDMPTGTWLEETAAPYYVFTGAGHEVEIVSIAGGEIPIDAGSMKGDFMTADCTKFMADEAAQKLFKNSKKLADYDTAAVDAIYLGGGHGTCTDFLGNATLTQKIEAAWNAGKVVGADCHGPIALLGCKKADGTPLIAGKKVTGFSDSEEAAVGLTEKVPKLVETEMKALGAEYVCAADWHPHAVTDGKLVTGQNPQSSVECAKQVLAAM